VKNITGFGNSDKTQEANKIGRFGIGFKSVFAITDRPEIYTMLEEKPFAFAIEDLVIPVAIPGNHEKSHQYNTQFLFPFIKEQAATLYTKIKERLSSLGFETMLFLQNLASIEWQTETDGGVYLCDVKGSHRELVGESRDNGQIRRSIANYLLFTRDVHVSDKPWWYRLSRQFLSKNKTKLNSSRNSFSLTHLKFDEHRRDDSFL